MKTNQTFAESASLQASSSNPVLAEALRLRAAGISVIPLAADGTKAPARNALPEARDEKTQQMKRVWQPFQTRLMTMDEAYAMFSGNVGISIVGGAVSGNLGCLDFDEPGLYAKFEQTADDNGAGALVRRLPLVETPLGGAHLRYRCVEPVGPCKKVATQSFPLPAGAIVTQNGGRRTVRAGGKTYPVVIDGGENKFLKCVIETKNEGGLTAAPLSPAACHPLNKPYVLLRGDLAEIPALTAEEAEILFKIARIFNTYNPPAPQTVPAPHQERNPSFGGVLPGEDFDNRDGLTIALETLQEAGWKSKPHGQGWYLWRPGKEFSQGHSASLNIGVPNALYVFSSNAPIFEMNKTYGPFAIYAHLKFNGDWSEAAHNLYEIGYGDRVQKPQKRGAVVTSPALKAPLKTASKTDCQPPSYRGDVATIQPKELAPDEIAKAVPDWVLELLGDIDAHLVDGRVFIREKSDARAIVTSIRRLWRERNTAAIQANYAMGILAASLDGRETGVSREMQIKRFFKNAECADQIRRFVWVASQWSPAMITQAIENGFAWSNIVEASAKEFSIADRQRFIAGHATVKTIRAEKVARKGVSKCKTNAQLLRELEGLYGQDILRDKLLALFSEPTEACGAIDSIDNYENTNTGAETMPESEWDRSDDLCEAEDFLPAPATFAVTSEWERLDAQSVEMTYAVVSAAPLQSVGFRADKLLERFTPALEAGDKFGEISAGSRDGREFIDDVKSQGQNIRNGYLRRALRRQKLACPLQKPDFDGTAGNYFAAARRAGLRLENFYSCRLG